MGGSLPLWVLLVHAGATCALAGLIWLVQVVHYPLFAAVDRASFPAYHRAHLRLVTRVVGPLMIVEAAAASWIAVAGLAPPATAQFGLALLAVVWGATFLLSVPRHDDLAAGFDAAAQARLVATNWIRTVAWSARAVVSLLMVAHMMRGSQRRLRA